MLDKHNVQYVQYSTHSNASKMYSMSGRTVALRRTARLAASTAAWTSGTSQIWVPVIELKLSDLLVGTQICEVPAPFIRTCSA
jgi:hypothetical protein